MSNEYSKNVFEFSPVAFIRSPFREKFLIPRQPGLAPSVMGRIEFLPPYNLPEMLDGLEQASHVWLLFVFHEHLERGWSPKVRPPRLGGNKKMGVWATRSSFRPNPIGQSVVKIESVVLSPSPVLVISGFDLVDGTPILDIKPYIPYCDAVADARSAMTPPTPTLHVEFSNLAESRFERMTEEDATSLRRCLLETLALDPRPAYQLCDAQRQYGARFGAYDVKFVFDNSTVVVEDIVAIDLFT